MQLFREEITYLAHWVSNDGVQPSNSNLKAIAECMLAQTYTEVHAFLGLVGHYRSFIKEFACIAQLFNECLAAEGARRKSEQVSLSEDALKAFEALKQACMTAPILAFADYTKPFLLRDWCIQGWIGGSAVTETSRRMIPLHCLWQQSPYASWEELSLD